MSDRFLVSLCNKLTKLLHPATHSPILIQSRSELQTEYDTPWKDALESYFEEFISFFFPEAHGDIDWRRGYEFLDKELQQVVRDAELGKRLVDKLVKIYRTCGEETWVIGAC